MRYVFGLINNKNYLEILFLLQILLISDKTVPFKSQKQRAFMYARHPEIAKRWEKETPKKKLNGNRQAKKSHFARALKQTKTK